MAQSVYCLILLVAVMIQSSYGLDCTPGSFHHLCMKDEAAHVLLENEKISLTIVKATGSILSLYYNSQKEPAKRKANLLQGGSGYYLGHIDNQGKAMTMGPGKCTMKVVANTADRIDLAFVQKDASIWPIEYEMHLVLEKGASIFYYYSVHRYTSDMPSGYSGGELRWALRLSGNIFKHFQVDAKRAGTYPRHTNYDPNSSVQDATYRAKDGTIYTKYEQISDDEGVSSVFGVYDDHLGVSLIQANKDFGRGGPFKQDLTTHTGLPGNDEPLLLFHEHSGHFGTPALVPTHGWSKVYGPIGYFINEGDSPSAMYRDAERQLKEEEKKWPYKWVSAPEYAANSRGSVSGSLKVADGTKPEWVYYILTDPHVDETQYESLTYMYSAKTSGEGKFEIPAVRAGEYKLQIIAKGVVGRHIQTGIKVQANHNTELGTINWVPESHGKLLWQIGIPDRRPTEFHVPPGQPAPIPLEEFRKFGTWLSYPKAFPNDVDFTIGKSDPAKDWCYFMPQVKTPANSGMLKNFGIKENYSATNWKVHFDYKGAGKGTATLTLGFAGASHGAIRVVINGHEIFKKDFEGPVRDSAMTRQGAHGLFRQYTVPFSSSLLKQGANLMEFTPPGAVSANHAEFTLMWDFLRLEDKE